LEGAEDEELSFIIDSSMAIAGEDEDEGEDDEGEALLEAPRMAQAPDELVEVMGGRGDERNGDDQGDDQGLAAFLATYSCPYGTPRSRILSAFLSVYPPQNPDNTTPPVWAYWLAVSRAVRHLGVGVSGILLGLQQ
jgi:hypothetical protein